MSIAQGYSPVANVRVVLSRRDRLAAARLYLCTDARRERGDLAEFADAAMAGGVDVVQLRDKGSAGEQRFGPLEAMAELAALEILTDAARRHGALVAVNDRADVARAAGADVLHLGQDDLPLSVARDIVEADTLIGRSTHDETQAAAATDEAVDYFCVGPCWPTPTKPGRSARPGARGPPPWARPCRGSRSAASTPTGSRTCDAGATRRPGHGHAVVRDRRHRRRPAPASRTCSTRAPPASWWCVRSPRPRMREELNTVYPAAAARELKRALTSRR